MRCAGTAEKDGYAGRRSTAITRPPKRSFSILVVFSIDVRNFSPTVTPSRGEKQENSSIEKQWSFVEELERRGERIRNAVREENIPEDYDLIPKSRQIAIDDWCNQVPVLGFNSGRYDLNLIKEYFVELITEPTGTIRVAKNANKIMFMLNKNFRFLDIINYLGPGTSYEKWVKAYGCTLCKSWFPYEWFDSPDKLDFPGLPDYPTWYSRLKGGYVLTRQEWEECNQLFQEKGMNIFVIITGFCFVFLS